MLPPIRRDDDHSGAVYAPGSRGGPSEGLAKPIPNTGRELPTLKKRQIQQCACKLRASVNGRGTHSGGMARASQQNGRFDQRTGTTVAKATWQVKSCPALTVRAVRWTSTRANPSRTPADWHNITGCSTAKLFAVTKICRTSSMAAMFAR